jgi:hypothetical protein
MSFRDLPAQDPLELQADDHESSFELALALPHGAFFWPQFTHVPCALASPIWMRMAGKFDH